MEPLAGDDPRQIAGYQLLGRLGAGGMGRVYLAFTGAGRPVALKVIRPEFGDDPDFRGRFRQEVEAARRVSGLYTAQVLDADPGASPPWLVTAYVPGPSLQQAVGEHGPLPVDTALLLTAGVAEALQAIHGTGLVHRDLKPANVLLAPDGPRVIDFGIARTLEGTVMTSTGLRVGSPPYMAPEQARGLPVTPATDVFALGSVIAFTVTGQNPFGGGSQEAILYRIVHEEPDLHGCPPPLDALVERCLAKAPARRPSTAGIIAECRAHDAGQPLQVARAWLPAAVTADLARHAAPPFPRPAADAGVPLTGVPVPPGSGYLRPAATSGLPTGVPPQPPPTAPAGPAAVTASPARVSRRVLVALAAVAAVALAGIGTALWAAVSSHGAPGSAGPPAAATTPPPATTLPAGVTGSASAPASAPAAQATGAACLAGSWQMVSQQDNVHVATLPVTLTGSGAKTVYRPDGTFTNTYDNVQLTSTDQTDKVVIQGTASGHWSVSGSRIFYTGITSHVTQRVYVEGLLISDQPLSIQPGVGTYRCAGDTFNVQFASAAGSETDELVRVTS